MKVWEIMRNAQIVTQSYLGFCSFLEEEKTERKFWLVIKVIKGKKRPYVARKMCATQGL